MSTRRINGRRVGEAGQALVEFALILPVILLLVVGMLEFARAWNLHQVMTDAAREGARRAVLADATSPKGQTKDSVRAAMWKYLARFGYDPQYSSIMSASTITPIDSFKVTGANITINLACPYRFAILPARPIMMRTTFTMRHE
jgi:Flp pilus assembly protein TadG